VATHAERIASVAPMHQTDGALMTTEATTEAPLRLRAVTADPFPAGEPAPGEPTATRVR